MMYVAYISLRGMIPGMMYVPLYHRFLVEVGWLSYCVSQHKFVYCNDLRSVIRKIIITYSAPKSNRSVLLHQMNVY